MKKVLKIIILPFLFIASLLIYFVTGKTNRMGYVGLRYLFVLTNGRSNDLVSKIISTIIPKYAETKVQGVLGKLSMEKTKWIVDDIIKNGFHVFDTALSEGEIDELLKFAETTKVRYLVSDKKEITYSEEKVIFDEKKPKSARYQFETGQLINNQTIQKLCFDDSIRAVANKYLKTKPILDIITMWWSVPFDASAEDRAAQKYHFDMDRFAFIKFFFYITDVDNKTGPHCYVRNSHRRIPIEVRKDRRIGDDEIKNYYASDDILEICGEKGSIIAVDTRGLHKGKPLVEGKRLLFQIQFSNSLFGHSYSSVKNVNLTDQHKKMKEIFRETYRLIG